MTLRIRLLALAPLHILWMNCPWNRGTLYIQKCLAPAGTDDIHHQKLHSALTIWILGYTYS